MSSASIVAQSYNIGTILVLAQSLAGRHRAHLGHFEYNDLASMEQAAEAANCDLAAILVSAFRHDLGRDQDLRTQAFASRTREICDQSGAALILDDVRAGFRIDLCGSCEPLGVRPDLSAYSKAIANGYPMAAVMSGRRAASIGLRTPTCPVRRR